MLRDSLRQLVQPFCPLSEEEIEAFAQHFELLRRWNTKINLTRIEDEAEAAVRHYGESAFLARWLPAGPLAAADLGAGGGFPGIPIAVLRPDLEVTLIESHQRKAAFLREAARSLRNVRVIAARGEAVTQSFDWLVSRAVAWKDLRRFVFRLAPNVALLTAEAVIPGEVARVPLPWVGSGFLVGVSRETSADRTP
ncbi:MAG: 16S rRNA (guanine(527)-N(7))-methyltransferase RsmG [Bryobacteraceae bacterium]